MDEIKNTGAEGVSVGTEASATEAEQRQAGEKGEQTGGAAATGKALTQAEVDALINKTIAKERQRADQRMAEAIQKAKAEGEKRGRMSEAERAQADAEQRESDLKRREAEIQRREMRAEARDTLSERGLPLELADLLNYTDPDACAKSIDTLESTYRAAVQRGVDERIRKSGANPGGNGRKAPVDTSKMSDKEYYAYMRAQKK